MARKRATYASVIMGWYWDQDMHPFKGKVAKATMRRDERKAPAMLNQQSHGMISEGGSRRYCLWLAINGQSQRRMHMWQTLNRRYGRV